MTRPTPRWEETRHKRKPRRQGQSGAYTAPFLGAPPHLPVFMPIDTGWYRSTASKPESSLGTSRVEAGRIGRWETAGVGKGSAALNRRAIFQLWSVMLNMPALSTFLP